MIYCFPSENQLAEKLSCEFLQFITDACQKQRKLSIALSGGNTPKVLFDKIAINQHEMDHSIFWNNVHFFWADERCVPPDHADSNYGMTKSGLFDKIRIPADNIHRIHGENDPNAEAGRYAAEITRHVDMLNGVPQFDWIFLGMGNDGHTASIFPERFDLFNSFKICEAVKHPVNAQFRITLTGKSLLQGRRITFMVTGNSKSTVVGQIFNDKPEAAAYPAAQIHRQSSKADWYMDAAAALYINTACHG